MEKGTIAYGDSRASEGHKNGIAAAARKPDGALETYTFSCTVSQLLKITSFINSNLEAHA
jgi:hypothetical protein